MRASTLVLVYAVMTLGSAAPQAPRPPAAGVLAMQHLAAAKAQLKVRSPSIMPGGVIPLPHSDYGEKISPELHWSGVPAAAGSLVIMMEDPDAPEPKPFVHWLLYNLPPTVTTVPVALPGTPRLPELGGALQGRTSRGNVGYFGPRPPTPDPPHHYHFQVFALDAMLKLDPAASREELLKAMAGHVVAAGEFVGTFKAPADAR